MCTLSKKPRKGQQLVIMPELCSIVYSTILPYTTTPCTYIVLGGWTHLLRTENRTISHKLFLFRMCCSGLYIRIPIAVHKYSKTMTNGVTAEVPYIMLAMASCTKKARTVGQHGN